VGPPARRAYGTAVAAETRSGSPSSARWSCRGIRRPWRKLCPAQCDVLATVSGEDGVVPEVADRSTAMLIVRVWREEGAFRATVSSSLDVMSNELAPHASASTSGEVLTIVEHWLQSV
jgi:hypothetical protein